MFPSLIGKIPNCAKKTDCSQNKSNQKQIYFNGSMLYAE